MRDNFKRLIEQITSITEEEFNLAMSYFHEKSLKKGDFFIQEGQVCKIIAYVHKGILRTFYFNENAEDVTYCFSTDHHFETSFKSFITQTPSSLSIQALEDSELLVLTYNDLQRLYKTSKTWEKIGRLLTEKEYLKMEEFASRINNDSAKEKYLRLIKEQPLILQKAPLIYISSYLGITPRHLSRIRKEIISGHMSGAENK